MNINFYAKKTIIIIALLTSVLRCNGMFNITNDDLFSFGRAERRTIRAFLKAAESEFENKNLSFFDPGIGFDQCHITALRGCELSTKALLTRDEQCYLTLSLLTSYRFGKNKTRQERYEKMLNYLEFNHNHNFTTTKIKKGQISQTLGSKAETIRLMISNSIEDYIKSSINTLQANDEPNALPNSMILSEVDYEKLLKELELLTQEERLIRDNLDINKNISFVYPKFPGAILFLLKAILLEIPIVLEVKNNQEYLGLCIYENGNLNYFTTQQMKKVNITPHIVIGINTQSKDFDIFCSRLKEKTNNNIFDLVLPIAADFMVNSRRNQISYVERFFSEGSNYPLLTNLFIMSIKQSDARGLSQNNPSTGTIYHVHANQNSLFTEAN